MTLASLNAASAADAEAALLSCCGSRSFAHSVAAGRPYASADQLLSAISAVFATLTWDDVLEAMRGHPRIGDRASGQSAAEQAGVTDASRAALAAANRAYEDRFGYVFLIRASGRGGEEILARLRERLSHDPDTERAVARAELLQITVQRARELAAGLAHSTASTHVLDATAGVPAVGVGVVLAGREAGGSWLVAERGVTGDDGRYRFARPLAEGDWRLTFETGPYFERRGTASLYPEVTITFRVRAGHYHVPLLLSPFAYSTYRGS